MLPFIFLIKYLWLYFDTLFQQFVSECLLFNKLPEGIYIDKYNTLTHLHKSCTKCDWNMLFLKIIIVQMCVCVCVCVYSVVSDSMTPRTRTCQTLLSVGFSNQKYWSSLQFPPQGDLHNPGLNWSLLHWQVDSLPLSHQGSPRLFLKYPLLPTGILVIIHFKIFIEG